MPESPSAIEALLTPDAAEPVTGSALDVGDGENAHFLLPHQEDNRVWKASKQCSPNLVAGAYVQKTRKRPGAASDEGKGLIDFIKEFFP